MQFGAPGLSELNLQIFDVHFQICLTAEHVTKFGWHPYGDPHRTRGQWRKCEGGSKNRLYLSSLFAIWGICMGLLLVTKDFPLVSSSFHSEDIRA